MREEDSRDIQGGEADNADSNNTIRTLFKRVEELDAQIWDNIAHTSELRTTKSHILEEIVQVTGKNKFKRNGQPITIVKRNGVYFIRSPKDDKELEEV